MTEKLYAERDAMSLDESGGYCCKHVSAMTGEGLHSKADIAAELGFRDMRIDQLLKERDDARTELSSAMLTISQITDVVGTNDTLSISQQVAELTSRCSALAAENAELKDLQPSQEMINAAHKEAEEYDNINLDDDLIVFIWQAMHSKLQTPTTDAAIANIQAQGVEMFAGWNDSHIENGDEYEDTLNAVGRAARLFAAQLRQEPTQ